MKSKSIKYWSEVAKGIKEPKYWEINQYDGSFREFLALKKKYKIELMLAKKKTFEAGFWVIGYKVDDKNRSLWESIKNNVKCLFSKKARTNELKYWFDKTEGIMLLYLNDKGREFILQSNNVYLKPPFGNDKDPYLYPEYAQPWKIKNL